MGQAESCCCADRHSARERIFTGNSAAAGDESLEDEPPFRVKGDFYSSSGPQKKQQFIEIVPPIMLGPPRSRGSSNRKSPHENEVEDSELASASASDHGQVAELYQVASRAGRAHASAAEAAPMGSFSPADNISFVYKGGGSMHQGGALPAPSSMMFESLPPPVTPAHHVRGARGANLSHPIMGNKKAHSGMSRRGGKGTNGQMTVGKPTATGGQTQAQGQLLSQAPGMNIESGRLTDVITDSAVPVRRKFGSTEWLTADMALHEPELAKQWGVCGDQTLRYVHASIYDTQLNVRSGFQDGVYRKPDAGGEVGEAGEEEARGSGAQG
eukprot:g11702.t1